MWCCFCLSSWTFSKSDHPTAAMFTFQHKTLVSPKQLCEICSQWTGLKSEAVIWIKEQNILKETWIPFSDFIIQHIVSVRLIPTNLYNFITNLLISPFKQGKPNHDFQETRNLTDINFLNFHRLHFFFIFIDCTGPSGRNLMHLSDASAQGHPSLCTL